MWTLAKQVKLHSFRKKPSYILLYIVVCKICSVYCFSSRYNFIAKSYPILDVLRMVIRKPDVQMQDLYQHRPVPNRPQRNKGLLARQSIFD